MRPTFLTLLNDSTKVRRRMLRMHREIGLTIAQSRERIAESQKVLADADEAMAGRKPARIIPFVRRESF